MLSTLIDVCAVFADVVVAADVYVVIVADLLDDEVVEYGCG